MKEAVRHELKYKSDNIKNLTNSQKVGGNAGNAPH